MPRVVSRKCLDFGFLEVIGRPRRSTTGMSSDTQAAITWNRRPSRALESGPQHFVTLDDSAQGGNQRGNIQRSFEPVRRSNVVRSATWFKLFQEPEPLLCK